MASQLSGLPMIAIFHSSRFMDIKHRLVQNIFDLARSSIYSSYYICHYKRYGTSKSNLFYEIKSVKYAWLYISSLQSFK